MQVPVTGEEIIKVTEYNVKGKLPNPFIFNDGSKVLTAKDWEERKKEIFKVAVELPYGVQPPKPEFFEVEQLSNCKKGDTVSYKIYAGTNEKQVSLLMRVFRPDIDDKVPAVVCGDACWSYSHDKDYIKAFTDNGIALIMFNRLELAHDIQYEGRSKGALYKVYPNGNYGALAAWAWGFSRCVDALETFDYIDTDCIAFTGHSRGAKTAMLAGVLDERAAIVNPNETNQGSCSCYRIDMRAIKEDGKELRSETLTDLSKNFDFWISQEFATYAGREDELPFDAHYLKALVAPRKLCVWEAASDIWTNPIGSWQTTLAAGEVFKFLGAEENLIWYFRTGYHSHDICDVKQLVKVIKAHRGEEPLDDTFYKVPFKKPELIFDWKCPETK